MNAINKPALGRALALATTLWAAQSHAGDIAPVANFGFDFGGDEIITFVFTDGSENTISGGQGLSMSGGATIGFGDAPAELQTTIGYKFDSASASNGSASFSRIPLEILGFFKHDMHRVGGGLTYHMSPTFKCDFTGLCAGESSFDSGMGFILQYDMTLEMGSGAPMTIAARYTSIKYSLAGAPDLDGSGVGFSVGWVFH